MKNKHLTQLLRFSVTGLGATAIHICVAVVAIERLEFVPGLANGVALVMATIFSYVANTYWSFGARSNVLVLTRYWTIASIACFLAVSLSSIADYLHWHYLIGILLVVLVVPVFSFLLHKYWTYNLPS